MTVSNPYTLTMELTHRCPLRCLYCSNPLELVRADNELLVEEWLSIIDQAAKLSVVQANLTGGEPLAYAGLPRIIERLKKHDIYSNLITSGIGLTEMVVSELIGCGLESIQISIQSASSQTAQLIADRDAQQQKLAALKLVANSKLPLALNVVLHRHNLHEVAEIIDLAHSLGVKRLELANTQYYGFAVANMEHLLPTQQQMSDALVVYETKKNQLQGKMHLSWIIGDYIESSPKPCMGGWASQHMVISVNGTAYPCLAASAIKTLSFPSTKENTLEWIWKESPAFNAFRGFDWMVEPCRTCEFREKDLGGCRCQAFLLAGDAAQADPVCKLSPHHDLVKEKIAAAESNAVISKEQLIYRM